MDCRRSIRRRRCCRCSAAARRCSRSRRRSSTRSRPGATVVMPNPFYQIYEGAALLAGAEPYCVNARCGERGFAPAWRDVPDAVWARTQLVYVCSPDNPTGRVTTRGRMAVAVRALRSPRLRDRRRRVLFGNLFRRGDAAAGRARRRAARWAATDFRASSSSAACRSARTRRDCARATSPATRRSIKAFLLYRTYHGSAMSPAVAAASIAAWSDEAHVRANRAAYAAKFAALQPRLAAVLPCAMPDAAFYLWARTPDRRRRLRAAAATPSRR